MMLSKLLSPLNSNVLLRNQKEDRGWMKYLRVYKLLELPKECENEVFRASQWKNVGSFEGDEFWETAACDYDRWVCTLASSLLSLVENPLLKILQDLAAMKTGFAELIMPFVFQDLALGSMDQSHAQQTLSTKISWFILKRADTAQRASQLVLSCLEFLRHCHRDWAACRWAGRKSLDCVAPEGWSKVYWLDVDYMEVALAAFQCSAYFTSLEYVEHWCEDSCGGLKLPETLMDDLDQQTLPVVDGLLLDIYRSVSEPDGLFAVARTPHMKSQLTLVEHEGNWEDAATLYDLAHSTAPFPSNEMHLGLLNALRHLSWNSTLKGRLEHLKTTGIWHEDFSDIRIRAGVENKLMGLQSKRKGGFGGRGAFFLPWAAVWGVGQPSGWR
ncbi:hypothetical protein BSKO_11737 [Bryopsis sp. KO-2023]|nr:hypothetical protein BSKO_11737 [Bryopsis sp. KO-2023]